ncbi:MAG TPA: pilus assembly protein TadG-related protein [Candidatus Limnocylindrales bacterium]
MARPSRSAHGRRGQILVVFALASTVIILAAGLVIDGGYALAQRRGAQNAADFAALAGARVIAEWVGGDTANGTDANVQSAIANSIQANQSAAITFGAPNGPVYVTSSGAPNGFVGAVAGGAIPAGTVGVTVASSRTWNPFFLGVAGFSNWTASAVATAKGGYSLAGPPGDVFPAGVSQSTYETFPLCSGEVGSSTSCQPVQLTPGSLNVPGGFGWLKFGAAGKCTGFGLGMINAGCDNSKPFLQSEIGPPANSYGCCTAVTHAAAPADRIGSLPGNKASADCTYYISNKVQVIVPIWDVAGGSGANAWYHIVGFAGMQLTTCDGGKDIQGVLRQVFFPGPTTTTPQPKGSALGIELVR